MRLMRFISFVVILIILAVQNQGAYTPSVQAASGDYIKGTFITVWGDGAQDSGESFNIYFLIHDQGKKIRLIIREDLLYSLGGSINFNQNEVIVRGKWLDEGESYLVQRIHLAEGVMRDSEGIYGPQPWASVLCKFADVPGEPNNLAYFQGMYSTEYPGLDHYWRQQSYDRANLQGSGAYGWFTLPHPRSYYLPGGNLDWQTAAAECTAVADPYINFTQYVGINLMFNDLLDCCAWGGGWYACLDGKCKVWRTTWEPPWGYQNIGVIAHETGHGFGLPHSLGNCQKGYDNRWDVLSDVWSNGSNPIYGTMGQHTISYHKQILEWFTPQQVFTAGTGSNQTITLERLAIPQTNHYLEARILIHDNPNHFYTLEVRQPTGNPVDYDKWLPGFAVIIHEVDVNRQEPAVVIDQDGDCNTGDGGAMYLPGEVFTDILNGITVSVDSATATGYIVSIKNHINTMVEVEITGNDRGYIGESMVFTANVHPNDATIPITYTWEATGYDPIVHIGDIMDEMDFTWDITGSKAITVTASNDGGTVVDMKLIQMFTKVLLPISLKH